MELVASANDDEQEVHLCINSASPTPSYNIVTKRLLILLPVSYFLKYTDSVVIISGACMLL